jgi:hypothetical protein
MYLSCLISTRRNLTFEDVAVGSAETLTCSGLRITALKTGANAWSITGAADVDWPVAGTVARPFDDSTSIPSGDENHRR